MHFRMATLCKLLTSISAALWSSISLIYRFTSPHMPAHRAQAGQFTGCIFLWPEQAELATLKIYGHMPCDSSLCLSIKMKVHSASSNTRIHCVCMDVSTCAAVIGNKPYCSHPQPSSFASRILPVQKIDTQLEKNTTGPSGVKCQERPLRRTSRLRGSEAVASRNTGSSCAPEKDQRIS
jgi:hypothetical protein